jgi:enoyl-CoA hydratase
VVPVIVEQDGAVATVRVDNATETAPENFLTDAVVTRLWDTLTTLEKDRGIRAVVLTGAGRGGFIGHYDIDEIVTGAQRVALAMPRGLAPAVLGLAVPLARARWLRRRVAASALAGVVALVRFHQVTALIRRSRKVYVAAVDGPAFGGGLELALACDVRVAGDGGDLGLIEVLLGLVPGGGGSQLLARALGPSRALELLLEGRPLTAEQALRLGLVHLVVPREEVLAQARVVARRLARRSPDAVRAVKHAVHQGGSLPLDGGLAVERSWFLTLAGGVAAKTALRHLATRIWHSRRAGLDPEQAAALRMKDLRDGVAVELGEPLHFAENN